MKRLAQIFPLLLAVLLQFMPLLKTILAHPAAGSTCAFILRWGIGAAAAVGAYDTVSAASNYFTSSSNFTGTVGVFFTNKLTILSSAGDGGALCTVTANGTSIALANGQTTTNGMPRGLTLKFFDPVGGPNSLYITISGTPSAASTNLFGVDLFYSGSPTVHGDFSIKILSGGGTAPTITAQPAGLTTVAGSTAAFAVTASGTPAVSYQWRFNTSTVLAGAANTLSLPQVRAGQSGNYTVVITNSAGAVTSSVAVLAVTNPLPRVLTAPAKNGNSFQFTFVPVVGLTNTVQAIGALPGGAWSVFSNVPPPASAAPVTLTDPFGSANKFYRVLIQP